MELKVLGELIAARDGHVVALPRGISRRLLLALVVQEGRRIDDRDLVEELWGDAPPPNALFSLRNSVARLRKLLGNDLIAREHGGYRLDRTFARTDVEEFDALVTTARSLRRDDDPGPAVEALHAAFRLVRGTPLPEVADEVWAQPFVTAVDERILSAEELLADIRLQHGLADDAIARFHRAARAQPQRERRWRQLVQAHAQTGRRVEALRAAAEARSALAEFGLVPGPALIELEHEVLGSETRPPVTSRTGHRLVHARRTAMVGRDGPLATLLDALAVTWLTGEAGLGKTRLLAEVALRSEDRGARVIYGPCERSPSSALQLIADLARGALAASPADLTIPTELAALLGDDSPDDSDARPHHDPGIRYIRLRDQIRDLFDAVAHRSELVVIVDDVQWIDEPTADVLTHLIERAAPDIRWILSAQPQRRSPEAAKLHAALQRTMPITDVVLEPLGLTEVVELVAALAPDIDATEREMLAAEVLATTDGNPLFATELISHRRSHPADTGTPPRLDVLVTGTLAELTPPERALVDALVVVGNRCPADVVAVAAGATLDEVLDACDRLVALSLITPPQAETIELRHDLIRSAINDHLSPATERTIRRRIVDALADDERASVMVAGHLLALGAPERADEADRLDRVLSAALATLLAIPDFPTADRLARRYLEIAGDPDHRRSGLEARLQAATALVATGAVAEGQAVLASVETMARDLDDPVLRADAMLARGPIETGDPHLGSTADEAEAILDRLPVEEHRRRVQLGCWAAHHRVNTGERTSALRLLDDVDATISASPLPLPHMRGLALAVRAQADTLVSADPTDLARSLATLQSYVALTHDELIDAAAQMLSVGYVMSTCTFADVRQARDVLAERATSVPRPDLLWWPLVIDAALALGTGNLEAAPALIDAAERRGRELAVSAAGATALTQRSQLMRFDGSLAALTQMLADAARGPSPSIALVSAAGLACVVAEDRPRADVIVERLRGISRPLNTAGSSWPIVASAIADLCWFTGDQQLADEVWDELSPWTGHGLALHCVAYFGAADRSLGLLAAASGRRDQALELLAAADQQDRVRGATAWADRAAASLATLSLV